MIWSDAPGVRSESLECYPGLAVLRNGYLNVAYCSHGSGDSYFINVYEGDDPPIYQLYHDVSDQPEVILAEGRRVVAASLSEFFGRALV